jgi:hypothetical protein
LNWLHVCYESFFLTFHHELSYPIEGGERFTTESINIFLAFIFQFRENHPDYYFFGIHVIVEKVESMILNLVMEIGKNNLNLDTLEDLVRKNLDESLFDNVDIVESTILQIFKERGQKIIDDYLFDELVSSIMKEFGIPDEDMILYYEFINSFEEEMFDIEYQDFLFNTGLVFNYDPFFEYPFIEEPFSWEDETVEETSPIHTVEETSPIHTVKKTSQMKPFDPARYDRICGILHWFKYSRIKKWVKSLKQKREFVKFTGQRPNEESFEYSLMIDDDGLPVPSQVFKFYPAQMISFVIWYFNKHHSIQNHPLYKMSWYEFILHLLGDKYQCIANCGRVFVDGIQATNCPVNWDFGQNLVISYSDSSHTEDFNAIEVVGTKVTVRFTDEGLLQVVKFYL